MKDFNEIIKYVEKKKISCNFFYTDLNEVMRWQTTIIIKGKIFQGSGLDIVSAFLNNEYFD